MADKYLNFLRDELSEAVAATLAEATIKTGLSFAMGGRAMEVWNVVSFLNVPDIPAAGAEESTKCSLAGQSGEAAIPSLGDAITLYHRKLLLKDDTPIIFNEGYSGDWNPRMPLLYAHAELYHYVKGTSAGVMTSIVKIGMVYIDMGNQDWYEVLQQYQQAFG